MHDYKGGGIGGRLRLFEEFLHNKFPWKADTNTVGFIEIGFGIPCARSPQLVRVLLSGRVRGRSMKVEVEFVQRLFNYTNGMFTLRVSELLA